jgi:hypothetical protein
MHAKVKVLLTIEGHPKVSWGTNLYRIDIKYVNFIGYEWFGRLKVNERTESGTVALKWPGVVGQ